MKTNILAIISILMLVLMSCSVEKTTENTATGFTEISSELEDNLQEENNQVEGFNGNDQSLAEQFYNNKIGNLKCTMHFEREGGVVDQVLYISGIKIKSESIIEHKGEKTVSNILSDGEYTYIWGDAGAFKMKVENDYDDIDLGNEWEDDEERDELGESSTDLKTTLEQIPNNKCVQWIVDETIFELPGNIDFQDFSTGFQIPTVQNIEIDGYQNIENMPNLDDVKNMLPDEYK